MGIYRHLVTTLPISSREWDLYRTFLSVGLLENVDLIKADLSISIPTVRRRIARLEALHGFKLCRNVGSRFTLTPDGQALLGLLRSADDIIADLNQFMVKPDEASLEVLQIRSTQWLIETLWMPLVQSCPAMFEHLRLKFSTLDGRDDDLQSDMVVSVAPQLRISAGDNVETVGSVQSYFGGYPGYVETHGIPRLEDLREHVFIRSDCFQSDPEFWDEIIEIERRCSRSIRVPHHPIAHRMARAGLGFTAFTNAGQFIAEDVQPFPHLGRRQSPVFAVFHGSAWRGQRGFQLQGELLKVIRSSFRGISDREVEQ